MSAAYSQRDLFGGAIQAEVPVKWIDTSTIRPIPDNQEVFQSPHTTASIITDITERAGPHSPNDLDAIHLHIQDLYDEESGETIEIVEEIREEEEGGEEGEECWLSAETFTNTTTNANANNAVDGKPHTRIKTLRTAIVVTHRSSTNTTTTNTTNTTDTTSTTNTSTRSRLPPWRKSHIKLYIIRLPPPYSSDILIYATVPYRARLSGLDALAVVQGNKGGAEDEVEEEGGGIGKGGRNGKGRRDGKEVEGREGTGEEGVGEEEEVEWRREIEQVRDHWERFIKSFRIRDWGLFVGE